MKVDLIDCMGSDLTVVNAARVSFDKESKWGEGTGEEDVLSDKDSKLISYLAEHSHWTPFAHCMITLRETVPIFVARQRFKHMVGFTYNEVSRRYVDDEPTFYHPDVWRKRADNKKQGSSDEPVDNQDTITNYVHAVMVECNELYLDLLKRGVAPEQARMVLPQSMYTSYYVTGSLAAFARAYIQRIDPHSQKEIQDLAKMWDEVIRPLFPCSWNALTGDIKLV